MVELQKRFAEAELLVSPDALSFIQEQANAGELAEKAIKAAKEKGAFIVDKKLIEELVEKKEEKKIPLPVEVRRSSDFKPIAKEYEPDLKLYQRKEEAQASPSGHVEDFVKYFRNRLAKARRLIEANNSHVGAVLTSSLKNFTQGREVRLIGIVTSKKKTKKEDLLLEIEDEEGIAKVWVGKGRNEAERQIFEDAKNLINDECVAIDGKISGPFVIASRIVWPDIPARNLRLIEKDLSVAFISDVHVGSKLFLENEFRRFVQWLNGGAGNEKQREVAGTVKYLILAGDLVDGIGIYPKQEKELLMRSIFDQYGHLAKLLQEVPDYIEILVAPGNHDAVHRAEPQPRVSGQLAEKFEILPNVHMVPNPAYASIEGLHTLIYHGTSLDSIINAIHGLSYSKPERPMVELLKRRHLSPIFGTNPIVPSPSDALYIDQIPDIAHMGHIHKNGYENYKGTLVVNSGTWQARTDFQVKQGHVPSPCHLPVYSMKRGDLQVINFSDFETEAPPSNLPNQSVAARL